MKKIFFVVLIVSLVIAFMMLYKKKERKGRQPIPKRRYTIKDCTSKEDLEFKIDTYQKNIEEELLKSKKAIQEAKRKGYIKASVEWTNRFQELNRVSYTLEKNLEYENSKKLNLDKFHRYTSLHFRSMIIGNLAYDDYCASKKVRDELNNLLVAIGKKKVNVSSKEKKELYDIKDTSVKTTKYLYERMISFQDKTAKLRDKIGFECGERGRTWYEKIMANKENVHR